MLATFTALAALLILVSNLSASVLPAGTKLEIRLSTPAGSRISHQGDAINATVIAPVIGRGRLVSLQGATLSGEVANVEALGLGLKHRIAKIRLSFESLTLADGSVLPLNSRVQTVETARERVDGDGTIGGIDPTANLSSGISMGLSVLCINPGIAVPAIAIKFLALRSPDSEISLPAGTEMMVELTRDLAIESSLPMLETASSLTPDEVQYAQHLLGGLPSQQANIGGTHTSDLVNLMLIGSTDQVDAAFRAAGWTGASRHDVMALYRMYKCLVQRSGYRMAPMARLTLNGSVETKAYQKSLDTFAKRHHIRLWNQPDSTAWLGAATEDVAFTVRRMHVTHAIDSEIDNERAKVVNDLWFTGCVAEASLLSRDSLKPVLDKGFSISTDGDIAVLKLNSCQHPRMSTPSVLEARQRSKADEAMTVLMKDIARSNPLTVGYSFAGAIFAHANSEDVSSQSVNGFLQRKSASADRFEARRPSIIDIPVGQYTGAKDRPLNAVHLSGQSSAGAP